MCNGQLLPISQNTALFALLGTTYGGDGRSTFGLPDLQGAAPMFHGQGNNMGNIYGLGQSGGTETITLQQSEIPVHQHQMLAAADSGLSNTPGQQLLAQAAFYSTNNSMMVTMSSQALTAAGGSLPHNNMQPYLTLNFCIALQGIFPPRQ